MNIATHSTGKYKKTNALAANPAFFQPKLTINQPNDIFEQEADAAADKIMRMPAATGSRFFQPSFLPSTAMQRKCAHCEEEEQKKVQKKTAAGSEASAAGLSAVSDVVQTTGQPLDADTRNFMEAGFGYDFGNVQIHNDALANQSSSAINALAYTHHNHIVFGAGQYQPNTAAGQHLLAHELTHVIQQAGGVQMIQRQFTLQDPAPQEKDPIPIIYAQETGSTEKDKTSIGFTTPTFNGKKLSDMNEHDLSGLFVMNVTGEEKDGVTCLIDTSSVNATVSAEELTITQPNKSHEWTGSFKNHPDASCNKKQNIPVVIKDTSAGGKLYDIILKNENDHVTDLKKIIEDINTYLGSIDKFQAKGKDMPECSSKLVNKVNKTANPALGMAHEFLQKWKASIAAWDNSGKHNIKKEKAKISKDCSGIEFDLH